MIDMADNRWLVHKFGGSSVADAECFRRVADILLAEKAPRQAVVVSAMAKMTDALLSLVAGAEKSPDTIAPGLDALATRYRGAVHALLPQSLQAPLLGSFEADLADARDVLHAISLVRSAAERSRDLIAGFGELWSSRLLAAYLSERCRQSGANRPVRWVDARQVIVIEHGDLGPAVQWEESRQRARRWLGEMSEGIAVVTGFIASDKSGLYTTLGRNGSDFSASIIGALVEAREIIIWTDVDGVMSADPNRVPEAAIIRDLSYSEAMELAYFGAKVIHPQTMAPAVQRSIPIFIKNTFNPGAPGSRIGPTTGQHQEQIKGVTSVDDVALVNLEGTGMIGVPGTADRLFGALRSAGISVILISQASSEHSICFAVPSRHAVRVAEVVRQAFTLEIQQGQIQSVDVKTDCSIIAVVGDGMAGLPGIAAKFFGTLGDAGISVRAIAQGSSERNISAVIDKRDATRALRATHSGFYLSAKTISIGLIGPGNVGATLLDQMAEQGEQLRREFGLDLRVRAIATSGSMLLADRAIDLRHWREVLERGTEPLDWGRFVRHVQADHIPHAAMVDCSASQEVANRYLDWFRAGIHVATPNKKAHSGTLASYDALQHECRRHKTHFLYETTVGAALPVIGTLRDLKQTGDEILSIEGILSGTLAYLFNVFDGQRPFSSIVREARDKGYTEPDPRDDLSGMDFARKLIILGREMGLRLEMKDIAVETLVPTGLSGLTIEQFLDALPQHDARMLARLQEARGEGKVLRYVGRLSRKDGATVRLEALAADHPFAHMNLTDNIVRYESRRYSANPLVVQGPGAGPAVTAAGVFADLLRLASYLGPAR
ncbi:MAG: bifunctional aspartate kinase/homoserine dehydrogenase I [Gammaproteobacteria bacterium]|nr:MAG: bifunctional aspartate kinase/homoserine dehydrogenase I [Gammaproteobacteria bacterium]